MKTLLRLVLAWCSPFALAFYVTNALAQHTVTVNFAASTSQNVTSYKVYRRTPTGVYTIIGTAANAPLVDAGVTSGATYMYVATAVDSTGQESVFSNEVTAIIPNDVPPPPPTGLISLWPTSTVPAHVTGNDGASVELGTKFSVSVAGRVIGISYYKATNSTSAHTASLWNSAGARVGSLCTFQAETTSGWQTCTFASPLTITVGATYTATIHTTQYVWNSPFAWPQSVAPLTSPTNAGVFRYGTASAFPSSTWNSSNYYVTPLFQPSGPPMVTVTVAPTSWTMLTGASKQFVATVMNVPSTAVNTVNWSASGGTISAFGLFTSNVAGSYTITATSVADTTKTATASVIVTVPPPTMGVICVGLTCTFTPANMTSGTTLTVTGTAGGVTTTGTTTIP